MHLDKISIPFSEDLFLNCWYTLHLVKKLNVFWIVGSSSEQQLEGCLKYCCCVWKTLIRTLFVRLLVCQHWHIKEVRSTAIQYKESRTGSNWSTEPCTKIRWEKCEVHLNGGNCLSLFAECRCMFVDLDGVFLD